MEWPLLNGGSQTRFRHAVGLRADRVRSGHFVGMAVALTRLPRPPRSTRSRFPRYPLNAARVWPSGGDGRAPSGRHAMNMGSMMLLIVGSTFGGETQRGFKGDQKERRRPRKRATGDCSNVVSAIHRRLLHRLRDSVPADGPTLAPPRCATSAPSLRTDHHRVTITPPFPAAGCGAAADRRAWRRAPSALG
jgi:hypothetical protein